MARFIAKTSDNDMIRVYYDVKDIFVDVADCISMEELAKEYVENHNSFKQSYLDYGWIIKDFHKEILDKPLKVTYVEHIPQIESSIANNEYEGYVAIILEYFIDDRDEKSEPPYQQYIITTDGNEDQVIAEFFEDVAYNDVITINRYKAEIIL